MANWDRSILTDIDGDKLRHDPRLKLSSMWVLTTTSKNTRCFHTGVARLFKVAIEECKLVLGFDRLLGFLLDSLLFGRSRISLLSCSFHMLSDVLEIELL